MSDIWYSEYPTMDYVYLGNEPYANDLVGDIIKRPRFGWDFDFAPELPLCGGWRPTRKWARRIVERKLNNLFGDGFPDNVTFFIRGLDNVKWIKLKIRHDGISEIVFDMKGKRVSASWYDVHSRRSFDIDQIGVPSGKWGNYLFRKVQSLAINESNKRLDDIL